MIPSSPNVSDNEAPQQAADWYLRAKGGLTPDEQASFDAWLDADPAHRSAFREAGRVWHAVGAGGLSPGLLAMRTEALESFRRAKRAHWARRLPVTDRRRRFAWVTVLVLAISGLFWAQLPETYETGRDERRLVVLADGSKLSLDASTRVSVRYTRDRRALQLSRGRAKFEVAKNSLRLFTVTAADKVVVATGTAFSVELLRKKVHVILYEGRVAVLEKRRGMAAAEPLRHDKHSKPADQLLVLGNELVTAIGAPVARITPVDPIASLAWESGQLVFDDEPLVSAVERVNRHAAIPLRIGDQTAGTVRISGVFAEGDTAAFVEGVTTVFPVRAREAEGHLTFFTARSE